LELLHALFQILDVPTSLAHLRVYPGSDLLILRLLTHLVRGIEQSSFALDLLVDRAECVIVVVHNGGDRRVSPRREVFVFCLWYLGLDQRVLDLRLVAGAKWGRRRVGLFLEMETLARRQRPLCACDQHMSGIMRGLLVGPCVEDHSCCVSKYFWSCFTREKAALRTQPLLSSWALRRL